MKLIKSLIPTALVGLSLSLGLASIPQSTNAAVTCAQSPSQANCDNKDPIQQGCNDGYTVTTAYYSQGKVELRYSPKCGTNWTRVTNYSYGYMYGRIERSGGTNFSTTLYGTSLYTNMVYAPTTPARAYGYSCNSGCGSAYTGWY